MPDKTNKLLENKGWAQMSEILETEMPQEKRKRTPYWLFLLLGLFLVTGTLIFSYHQASSSTADRSDMQIAQQEVKPESTLSHMATPLDKSEDFEMQNGNPVNELNLSNVINNGQNPKLDATDLVSQNQTVTKYQNSSDGNEIINQGNMVAQANVQNKQNDVETKNGTTYVPNDGVKNTSNIVASENTNRTILQDDQIDIRSKEIGIAEGELDDMEVLTYTSDNQKNVKPKIFINLLPNEYKDELLRFENVLDVTHPPVSMPSIVDSSRVKSFSDYIFAGGMLDTRPAGRGFLLGVGHEWSINSMSLITEAGYARVNYQLNRSEQSVFDIEFDVPEAINSIVEPDIEAINELQQSVNSQRIASNNIISNLDYIFLNVGLRKNIGTNFYIQGGLSVARFINIRNFGITLNSNVPLFSPALSAIAEENSELFDSGVFSKFELAGRVSTGYKITPNLELSAAYRFGLTNLISTNDDPFLDTNVFSNEDPNGESVSGTSKIYRSGAEISIRYRF